MHAAECTCKEFLAGTIQYIVPSFQRPYSWGQERWHSFYDGVLQVYRAKHRSEIFLGAVAIMPIDSTPSGLQKYLLVDGQQRLITMLALIAALRNCVQASHPRLARKITEECLLNPNEEWNYRYKLLPSEHKRKPFFKTLEGQEDDPEELFAATRFFMEQLRASTDLLNMDRLYDLLLRQFVVVRIELGKDENPYPIFKSLNMMESPRPTAGLEDYYRFAADPQLMALIAGGESQQLEFKEAVSCHSTDTHEVERHGATLVRTVAAFLNSVTGGTLLVGVADDGHVSGINREYKRIDRGKANWDGYHLYLRNMLRARLMIENPFRFYTISKHVVDGKDVCSIVVRPADAPVYVDKHLYVRSGNQTLEMHGPDLVAYVATRWAAP